MDRKFVNARSPLRLLERGLHGGLGRGNVGVVIAAPGVGKTPFLVAVALDELLRGGRVLHVTRDATVGHVRAAYDTVFEELAHATHLEPEAEIHAEIDRRRGIRAYPGDAFSSARLREAVKLEHELRGAPSLLVLEGIDVDAAHREELEDVRALAAELDAEVWLSLASGRERVDGMPKALEPLADLVSVALALEPENGSVQLRALKDHDNPDVSELRVALDPRTLLLVRA